MRNYMAFLERHNLSAWRFQFETDAVGNILARATGEAVAEARENPALTFRTCSRGWCNCAYDSIVYMGHGFAKAVAEVGEWNVKRHFVVCLDCLKGTEYSRYVDGESVDGRPKYCRVRHW